MQIERRIQSFAWDYMPAELRPNWKRKLHTKDGKANKVAKVVNIEETLKALEQKEVQSRRRENEDVIKEENKDSDNENENVNYLTEKCVFLFFLPKNDNNGIKFYRKRLRMKSKMMKWTRTTIMVSVISIMVMIIMKKMTISMMDRFIKISHGISLKKKMKFSENFCVSRGKKIKNIFKL